MATSLTKKNLQDLFDKILLQYAAVKTKQDTEYNKLKAINIDMYSQLSSKGDSTVEIPLLKALKNYQYSIYNLVTGYDVFSSATHFKTLFSALDTYFKSETSLTEKTINGFLVYNSMPQTDAFNRIYKGIIGRYLQARNVLVNQDVVVATSSVSDLTLGISPISSTYSGTAVDGETYTPFQMLLETTSVVSTGIKFTITFSDNTTETFDYLLSSIPAEGINVSALHSGVKSVAVVTRTMSDEDFVDFGFTLTSNYGIMTFAYPAGWEASTEDTRRCYVGTDETGTRVGLGETYIFSKGEEISLFLKIKPTLLNPADGEWTVDGTSFGFGSLVDGWYVTTYTFTPTTDFSITVAAQAGIDPDSDFTTLDIVNKINDIIDIIGVGTPPAGLDPAVNFSTLDIVNKVNEVEAEVINPT